jgi:hypothetical protein
MKAAHKRSFYLDSDIEEVLLKAPPKKLSERANELMHKGLLKEKEEAIALEYQRYAESLSKNSKFKSTQEPDEMTSTQYSHRLFKASEPDDSDDGDLI